jgi:hypothetical protein
VESALVVASVLLVVGCGGGRAGVAGAGGTGGVDGGVDRGVDVPPDSGPLDGGTSCNPDAGTGNLDGGSGGWRFFGAPLSVSPSGAFLPTMALLPDGSPVVAWTDDGQPESVITQFAPFNQAARTYTVVWNGCSGTWQAMGEPVAGTLPALLVPPGSNQVVRAWVSNDNPSVLTVERWNGTAFEALGAPFQALNQSIVSPVMVADASGNPILAWLDGLNSSTVQVAHWSGSDWQMLSPAAGVPGDLAQTFLGAARALSLTLTPDGLPIVAWPGTKVHSVVAEFVSGTTWTMLGLGPNCNTLSNSVNGPVVRVNSTGDIFLAWINLQVEADSNAAELVSVSRFDGTTWQALGGPLYSAYVARDYDMLVDGSGAPIVADSESALNGGGLVYSYRWNGTAWQKPAPGVAAAGPPLQTYVYTPTIAVDGSGRLVASWVHFENSMEYSNLPGNIVTTAIAVARYQP